MHGTVRTTATTLLLGGLWGCSESPSATFQDVVSIEVSPSAVSFASIADEMTLQAAARDAGGRTETGARFEWTSRDEAVARVDRDGRVTAVSNGQTWIVAASSGVRDSTSVTVAQETVSVEVSPAGDSIWTLGGTTRLTARPVDANGYETPDGPPIWKASDPSVATVDEEGVVTGVREGDTSISAAVGETSREVPLVVEERGAVRVRIMHAGGGVDPDGYTVSVGGRPTTVSEETVLTGIPPGTNHLHVSGVAEHCVWRDDGKPAHVVKGDTTELVLDVRCSGQYAFVAREGRLSRLGYVDEFGAATILSPDAIEPHHISWAPTGEWIAFSKIVGENTDIYLVRPDGTGERRLTTHSGRDLSPTWSPDGTRIAYRSEEEEGASIWVVDLDGTDGTEIRALPPSGQLQGPVWSPTEELLAFVTPSLGRRAQLWTMRPDGSESQPVGPNLWTLAPSWSPDGEKIAAFVSGNGQWDLLVMNKGEHYGTVAAGSEQAALAPSWSPDGGRLAFTRFTEGHYGVYVVGVDGSDQVYLSPRLFAAFDPVFTSDGSHILFRGADDHETVMAVDVDGTSMQTLIPGALDPRPRPGS